MDEQEYCSKIKNVHIKDRDYYGNTKPFGFGNTDFDIIFETLKENAKAMQIEFEYSSFDKALDDEILHLLASDYEDEPLISKSDLELVLMWYGDYLARLFAVSMGVTAFENELHDWVSVWVKALNEQPIPPKTVRALMNVLLPRFRKSNQSEGDHRLVSYLTSRTESISSAPSV